mmetsp:Transcript_40436/g.101157  ORF Transcript_40436/g.101157 Transcript_40436/m.101157 type:complete len:284 (-) Transcript_40436:67-918(-)
MSDPTSVRTSTVVLLAGTQRTTGTHSMVVVRRTITPLGSSDEFSSRGATAWRHLGQVRRMPSHLETHDVWKKCPQGRSRTSSSASYPTWQISHILSSASLSTWRPRILGADPSVEGGVEGVSNWAVSSPSDPSPCPPAGQRHALGWGHRSMTSSKVILSRVLRTSGGVPLALSSSSSLSLSRTPPPPCPFCCCAAAAAASTARVWRARWSDTTASSAMIMPAGMANEMPPPSSILQPFVLLHSLAIRPMAVNVPLTLNLPRTTAGLSRCVGPVYENTRRTPDA